MEEELYTMNHKKFYAMQVIFLIIAGLLACVYRMSTRYMDIKEYENESLKEELQKLEKKHLQIKGQNEGTEVIQDSLKEQQIQKENQIKILENEVNALEEEKLCLEKKILELKK